MADYPIMPVGTSDFLADTAHLSDAEMGLYWRMCLHLWRMPGRRFPNDDAWLAKRFRCEAAAVRVLVTEFFQNDGNWIWHKRIEREHGIVSKQSKKQSDRAKSRWNKEKGECRGNAPTPTLIESSLRSDSNTESSLRSDSRRLPASDEQAPLHLGNQPDLDALYYQRGKLLLGKKAGGVLTRLRAAMGGVGPALEVIERAQHKDSPAEYVAGAIRQQQGRSTIDDRYRPTKNLTEQCERVITRLCGDHPGPDADAGADEVEPGDRRGAIAGHY